MQTMSRRRGTSGTKKASSTSAIPSGGESDLLTYPISNESILKAHDVDFFSTDIFPKRFNSWALLPATPSSVFVGEPTDITKKVLWWNLVFLPKNINAAPPSNPLAPSADMSNTFFDDEYDDDEEDLAQEVKLDSSMYVGTLLHSDITETSVENLPPFAKGEKGGKIILYVARTQCAPIDLDGQTSEGHTGMTLKLEAGVNKLTLPFDKFYLNEMDEIPHSDDLINGFEKNIQVTKASLNAFGDFVSVLWQEKNEKTLPAAIGRVLFIFSFFRGNIWDDNGNLLQVLGHGSSHLDITFWMEFFRRMKDNYMNVNKSSKAFEYTKHILYVLQKWVTGLAGEISRSSQILSLYGYYGVTPMGNVQDTTNPFRPQQQPQPVTSKGKDKRVPSDSGDSEDERPLAKKAKKNKEGESSSVPISPSAKLPTAENTTTQVLSSP